MPQKNKGKGGKRHRRGKKGADEPEKVNAPFKKEGQEYAQVTKLLGNCRLHAKLFGSEGEKLCIIPGKLKKRCWINKEDIILVGTRDDYSDGKCDVLYKYTPKEARQLVKAGEISGDVDIKDPEADDEFVFRDDAEPNDEKDYFGPGADNPDEPLEIDLMDL